MPKVDAVCRCLRVLLIVVVGGVRGRTDVVSDECLTSVVHFDDAS